MTGKLGEFLTRTASDGQTVRMPIGRIKGSSKGQTITILAGQHGTEYAGIEAAMRVFRELKPEDVTGEIRVGLVVNEDSFMNMTQFAPTSAEISSMMLEVADGSDYIINCHGGEFSEGMYPYVICRLIGDEDADQKALQMAEVFGFPLISISRYRGDPPLSTNGQRPAWWLWPRKSIGDELRVPEITPEFGELGSRDAAPMFSGITNVLNALGFLPGNTPVNGNRPRTIGDRYWLTADQSGVFFPQVTIGQSVEKGQLLGLVRNYFGDVVQEVTAPDAGLVMNANLAMPVKESGFLLWIGKPE